MKRSLKYNAGLMEVLKKINIITFLIPVVTLILTGCMYDSIENLYGIPDCTETIPSYQDEIEPIILANCTNGSNCHNESGHHPTLLNYEDISSKSIAVIKRIQNGTMPRKGSGYELTEDEKTKIFCWINSGSPDN